MRWLPWRRKQEREPAPHDARSGDGRAGTVGVADRLSRDAVPRGAALTFARDALILSGAQVLVEDPDLLAATLPDGSRVRYTGSLARARSEADATLLVQGGAALGALLDEVARRGTRVGFALPVRADSAASFATALAVPPNECGRCARGDAAASLCAACPLRAGRLVLDGMGRVTGMQELRRYDAHAVEFTYVATYRDRDGRYDETHRLAYDCATGASVPPVALEVLPHCPPSPAPDERDIAALAQRAQSDLARTLTAGASLLALRGEAGYQGRLHDLALTHERLLREAPEARAEWEASYTAERARLADLFAVSVEAELASVAHVATTCADVVVGHTTGELALTVDLGRGLVLPPQCVNCGGSMQAGRVCARGHSFHATCAGEDAACPLCASANSAPRGDSTHQSNRGSAAKPAGAVHSLSVADLATLSEPLWRIFVAWYLATNGYMAEELDSMSGIPVWRLSAPDPQDMGEESATPGQGAGYAVALRLPHGRQAGAADIRAVLATVPGEDTATTLVLITPRADATAVAEAATVGARLVTQDELARFLAGREAAHASALAAAQREAEERADAACAVRRALLDVLAEVEKRLAACANTRRAAGRGPLAAAANTITAAVREWDRALLAWETLIADWTECFDERPAPDASLRILRTPDELRTLNQRGEHLHAALVRVLDALATTPGVGESGYTAWRRALLEQLTAACEALRWRVCAVDPEHWRDAARARDGEALARAEEAAQTAKHAAVRVAKAHDTLAARMGL
jgi:hypothetical protein